MNIVVFFYIVLVYYMIGKPAMASNKFSKQIKPRERFIWPTSQFELFNKLSFPYVYGSKMVS